MKFFSRKKDVKVPTKEAAFDPVVSMSERDYSELKENDVPLKFWIPEYLEKNIDELCTHIDTSASDLIRQTLFIHLYGRYDLIGFIERQDNRFKLLPAQKIHYSEARRSSTEPKPQTPPKPKSIADVKVWIPAKMKQDLSVLAQRNNRKISSYVREVLSTQLMGNLHDTTLVVPPGADDEE